MNPLEARLARAGSRHHVDPDEEWRFPPAGYRFVCAYDYRDENGELILQRGRFEKEDPTAEGGRDKEFRPRYVDRSRFVYRRPPGARSLVYRYPEVLEAACNGGDVFWTEGEKDADAGHVMGLVATTLGSSGAKIPPDFGGQMRGIGRLFILPDNDDPGRRHATLVAEAAAPFVGEVKIVELPDLPDHGDLSEFRDAGHSADDVWRFAEAADTWRPAPEPKQAEATDKPPAAAELLDLAADVELFHAANDEAWVALQQDSHVENHRVSSRRFAAWLRQKHWAKRARPVPAQAVADAIASIEARALYDGPERSVHLRVGEDGGATVIDLGRPTWEVVRVDSGGWQVSAESPVPFRRPSGMRPLPIPATGGDLSELFRFVNVEAEAVPLVLGFLVSALRSTGPYPILVLHGEQGSAKTTTSRVLRALIDPSTSPTRAAPKEERDLAIAANNAHVLCFDNLSHIPSWLSDGLCRLSTGGGFATRSLYTNDEESIFEASRPVILNGIEELAQRPDLLDRSLIVRCPVIAEDRRREERELLAEFEIAAPRLFGCLLDAVSTGLRRLPDVRIDRAPRLADFARFAVACEPALGLEEGDFLDAYEGNRAEAHELALDAAVIAEPLRRLVERHPWEGTYAELLGALTERVDDTVTRRRGWPSGARALSGQLKRLRPNLRAVGVIVEDLGRRHGGATLAIRLDSGTCDMAARPSPPSPPSPRPPEQGELR